MHLSFQYQKLINVLRDLNKIVISTASIQSLKGIYICAKEDEVTFIGSNGNSSIKVFVKKDENLEIIKTGEILIPGKILLDVIEKQNVKNISLEVQKKELVINSGLSITKINLLDLDTFPKIDFNLNGPIITLNSKFLSLINKKVAFAAAEQDQRLILNGINLALKNGVLTASATNSYRLAIFKQKIDISSEFDITFFARNIREVIPSKQASDVKLVIDENKINILYDNQIIQIRLIDAKYPEVQQLIPHDFISSFEIKPSDLINKIETVTVVSGQNPTPVRLVKEQNSLTIESKKAQIGGSIMNLENFEWKGEDIKITFDSKFMIQALKSFDAEKVKVNFAGEFKSIVINSEEESTTTQLVLPHRAY